MLTSPFRVPAGCTAISQTALRALAFRRPSLCVSGVEVASVAQIVDELTEGVGFGAAWGMGEAEAEVSEASSEASEEGGSDRTLGESGEGPMKTAANTLFSTREEYVTEGAITWDSIKAKTVESMQVRGRRRPLDGPGRR